MSTARSSSTQGTRTATPSFQAVTKESRALIDYINRLVGLGLKKFNVPLPQIAVAGDQSSGKSSVLEAISGIAFPRGTGTVTKCAIHICMKQGEPESATVFTQDGDVTSEKKKVKREELGKAIEEHQASLCKGAAISSGVIRIELTAHDVPDLTLVDLPGIVRTVTDTQDKSIIAEVDSLVEKYLKGSRTIILVVIPANTDPQTTDILTRAEKVDPSGMRTIGVLTKPDLIDKGAEASVASFFRNEVRHLHHGYYMVKCRSQEELKNGISREDLLKNESLYFKTHNIFNAEMKSDEEVGCRLGMFALTKKLTELMVGNIKQHLPALQKEIGTKLNEVNAKIEEMGGSAPATAGERRMVLQGLVQGVRDRVKMRTENDTGELPTHLNSCLRLFEEDLRATCPKIDDDHVKRIRKHIDTNRGRILPGFLNWDLFKQLIGEMLSEWRKPAQKALKSLEEKADGSLECALQCAGLSRYTGLHDKLLADARTALSKVTETATIALETAFKRESVPSTQNHYLFDTLKKIRHSRMLSELEEFKSDRSKFFSGEQVLTILERFSGLDGNRSNEEQEAEYMADFLHAYRKVSRKRFVDGVRQILDTHLITELYVHYCEELNRLCALPDADVEKIMVELPDIKLKRERLLKERDQLEKAHREAP